VEKKMLEKLYCVVIVFDFNYYELYEEHLTGANYYKHSLLKRPQNKEQHKRKRKVTATLTYRLKLILRNAAAEQPTGRLVRSLKLLVRCGVIIP
jgi:hypothetical protein